MPVTLLDLPTWLMVDGLSMPRSSPSPEIQVLSLGGVGWGWGGLWQPSGLKKWPLACGFMKTQTKGGILSYLGSIVSLYFVHLVSWSKCTTGGGEWLDTETWNYWSFPGGPVPKTVLSRCRGSGLNLWSENWTPHAATKYLATKYLATKTPSS